MRLGVTRLLRGSQTKELNGTVFIGVPLQIFQILNVDRILLLFTGYSNGYHGEVDMVVIPDYDPEGAGDANRIPLHFLSLRPSKKKCFLSFEATSLFLLFVFGNVLWK